MLENPYCVERMKSFVTAPNYGKSFISKLQCAKTGNYFSLKRTFFILYTQVLLRSIVNKSNTSNNMQQNYFVVIVQFLHKYNLATL